MSSARLETYDKMRVEVIMYIEASRRSGKLTKPSQGYYPQGGGEPTAMDVDSFAKGHNGGGKGTQNGGGKGDGKANPHKERVRHHCGKTGRIKADCWWKARPKNS